MIRVLLFGPVAQEAGLRELSFEYSPGLRLADIERKFQTNYPTAFEAVRFTAVNEVQTRDAQTVLNDNDVLAFMAGFSGG